MTEALLKQYKEREAQTRSKIEEFAKKGLDNGQILTEEQQSEMKKLGAERRSLNAVIEELSESLKQERESGKPVQKPTDPPTPSEQEQERAGTGSGAPAKQKLFRNIGEQLVAIRAAARGENDPRLQEVMTRANATGMSTAIDADGGFLLEPENAEGLLERIRMESILINQVTKRTVKGDSIKFNGIDETSRAKGQLAGGIQIFPADQADQYKASAPKFKKVSLELKKITGLYYATDEELQDIGVVEQIVDGEFASAFATEIDGWLYNGDGASVCEGFMNTPSAVTQAVEAGQNLADPLKLANLAKMRSRLLPGMRKDARFLLNQELEPYVMMMMIGNYPAFMPVGGYAGTPEDRLLNIPMNVFEHCEAPGTVGDIALVIPKRMIMIDKGGLKTAVSVHVRFLYDEQCFKFTYRFDAKVPDSAPLTPRKGTNTLSSAIFLGTRA